MRILTILLFSSFLGGCANKTPPTAHEKNCLRFKDRLGCTYQDHNVIRQTHAYSRTSRGKLFETVGLLHGRSLGGYLKTTDFNPENVHELKMYQNALSCIKNKVGSFDSSLNDLVAVETARTTGSGDADQEVEVYLDPKYQGRIPWTPRKIAMELIGESVDSMNLKMVDTKGTYGIHHGQVYSESRRLQEEKVANLEDITVYDCDKLKCIGRHYNGSCYVEISYTVVVLPKSTIKSSLPIVLDEAE